MEILMHTDKREISRKFCGLFYEVNRKPLLTNDSPDTKKEGIHSEKNISLTL